MEKERKKQIIKLCVAIISFTIIIILVATIMIRYQVEGDKNMPFTLSKIILISTAEGNENEDEESDNRWDFMVEQNNDVYIYIDKNEEYKGDPKTIQSLSIENISITSAPQVGEIAVYMPNSAEGRLFNNSEDFLVTESLKYTGATESNPQTLEIGRNGGSALIRFSNIEVGNYTSNKAKEITHDGSLLEKVDVTIEEVKFVVSFDIVIETENCKYRANVSLEMPCGDIIEEGTSSLEKTDMSDVIFKRESL